MILKSSTTARSATARSVDATGDIVAWMLIMSTLIHFLPFVQFRGFCGSSSPSQNYTQGSKPVSNLHKSATPFAIERVLGEVANSDSKILTTMKSSFATDRSGSISLDSGIYCDLLRQISHNVRNNRIVLHHAIFVQSAMVLPVRTSNEGYFVYPSDFGE